MFLWTIFFEAEANSENNEIKSKRDFFGDKIVVIHSWWEAE